MGSPPKGEQVRDTLRLEQEFMLGVTSCPEIYPSIHFHFLCSPKQNNEEYLRQLRFCYVSGRTLVIEKLTFDEESKSIVKRSQSFILSSASITAIRLNNNRHLIAVSEIGGTVHVYDAVTLRRRKIVGSSSKVHDIVRDVSFSSDSKNCIVLAHSSVSKTDYICAYWNIEKTAQLVAVINIISSTGKAINQASIAPLDSSLVFISGEGGMMRMMRLVDNHFRNITLSDARSNPRDIIDFSCHQWLPTENTIFLCSKSDNLISVESLEIKSVPHLPSSTSITSILPISSGLFIGTSSGSIDFYELNNDKKGSDFKSPRNIVTVDNEIAALDMINLDILGFETSAREVYFLLLSHDTRKPLNVKNDLQYLVTPFHTSSKSSEVVSIDLSSNKSYMLVSYNCRIIRLWNYSLKSIVFSSEIDFDAIGVTIHPSGLRFAIASSKQLKICSIVSDLSFTSLLDIEGSDIQSLQFSNGGHLLAFVDAGQVMIRETQTFSLIRSMRGLKAVCNGISWRHFDKDICCFGDDGTFAIWEVQRCTRQHEQGIALSNRLSTGSITSDFKTLFSIGNKNAIVEYNVESMSSTVIERQRGEQVECMNDLVFVACSGSIQVLDSNRKVIQEISCHSGKISHMKRHKSLLVTSSSDGSICIFAIKDLNVPESHFSVDECLISVSFLNEKENQSRLLHHKIEQVRFEKDVDLRNLEIETENLVRDQNQVCQSKLDMQKRACEKLEKSKAELELQFSNELRKLRESHAAEIKRLNTALLEKRSFEEKRLKKLKSNEEYIATTFRNENNELVNHNAIEIQRISDEYNCLIEAELDKQALIRARRKALVSKFDARNKAIEQNGDETYITKRAQYESRLSESRHNTKQIQEEGEIVKIKLDEIRKDVTELDNACLRYKRRETELRAEYKMLSEEVNSLLVTKDKRNTTLIELDMALQNASFDHMKLERSRYTLGEEIQNLRMRLEPFELNVSDLNRKINKSDIAFSFETKEQSKIKLQLCSSSEKLKALIREVDSLDSIIKRKGDYSMALFAKMKELGSITDHNALKEAVLHLYRHQNESDLRSVNDANEDTTIDRTKKSINDTKRRLARMEEKLNNEQQRNEKEYARLLRQNHELKHELKLLQGH